MARSLSLMFSVTGIVTVGAGGDSFYEYLPKTFLLTGNSRYMDAWAKAVESIQKFLLSPTAQDPNIQFVASITNGTVSYASDELVCDVSQCLFMDICSS